MIRVPSVGVQIVSLMTAITIFYALMVVGMSLKPPPSASHLLIKYMFKSTFSFQGISSALHFGYASMALLLVP